MAAGNGTVIGVPEKVIIANFTDEVNDTVLNCTVQQGDIETDTVWEIIPGQVDAAKFRILGDGRRENSNSNSIYGNKMSISAELMKKLDGVIIYCGSHAHPRQAKFEFHIKGKPLSGWSNSSCNTCDGIFLP